MRILKLAAALALVCTPVRALPPFYSLRHMDEHFDYWDRCTDNHYELKRRLSYCKSILADGRHRRVAVLTEMGNAYFDAGKYVEAASMYTEALTHEDSLYIDKLSESRTEANSRLEEALALSGRYKDAIDHVNERIKAKPDSAFLYNQRCWLRAIVGNELDSALTDCNEALRREPGRPATLDSRGLVNFKLGNLKEAEADYDAALVKNEKNPGSLFVRGVIKLRSGNVDGGNEDISAAKDLDRLIADHYASYGVKP